MPAVPTTENTVTAIVVDDDGTTGTDDDLATVSYLDALPTISVTKTPSTGSVPEPGGTVTFTVDVENTGDRGRDADLLERRCVRRSARWRQPCHHQQLL